ncbi:hypothetical protein VFPBJ_00138 [Purpureocillium lilacinum]|uniref:Uncharacterized protein n=1 Tax=Purpureocillium lilacinum TaxID=33203 RepID=A0A179H8S0_PURLI|nr:hypothetical protein VFPBJ_00138 [Purpureocillium lilacinum]
MLIPQPVLLPLPPGPYQVSSNGLHRLRMALKTTASLLAEPLHPDTEHFQSMAVALSLGLEMAETPQGRAAFASLGRLVDEFRAHPTASAAQKAARCASHSTHMDWHVNHFLQSIRTDFPEVIIGSTKLDTPDGLAMAAKQDWWQGSYNAFTGKAAGGIFFNSSRVRSMVVAHDTYVWASKAKAPVAQRYLQRWRTFLFMFACATLHELAHLFVCYLTRGKSPDTPEGITHLDYSSYLDAETKQTMPGFESGRWLENALYGGSLEFIWDDNDDRMQTGIPYLINSSDVAFQIRRSTIDQFFASPRRFAFPFPVHATPISAAEWKWRGLVSVGRYASSLDMPSVTPASVRWMQARRLDPMYSLDIEELRRAPTAPHVNFTTVPGA